MKARKALSLEVRRAEQRAEERDAQTAWQKAYKQVKVSVPLPPPQKKIIIICALTSHNQADNDFICAWPLQFKTAEACEFDTFDLARARDLYNSAAAGGHAGAQLRLAEAYEKGELGQEIDLQLALMWYRKAAEGGDEDAQT